MMDMLQDSVGSCGFHLHVIVAWSERRRCKDALAVAGCFRYDACCDVLEGHVRLTDYSSRCVFHLAGDDAFFHLSEQRQRSYRS